MGAETKIQWTDKSASPWHGCTKVAAGCTNCYAARQAVRNPGTLGIWGDDGVRVKSKSFIKNLRAWNKQGETAYDVAQAKWVRDCCEGYQSYPEPQPHEFRIRVFPSICDPFEDRPELVPWRQEMFAVADECPWVILLLLTKRPENVRRMTPEVYGCGRYSPAYVAAGEIIGPDYEPEFHRSNVYLGTSISTQADADKNIPELLKCRDLSPVLFVSAEPLLEEIDPIRLRLWLTGNCGDPRHPQPCEPRIDWLIAGGESGPHARPCRPEWIRSLAQQCKAASVACFVKQMGANVITRNDMIEDVFNDGESGWPDPDIEHNINGFREEYQGADCRIRLRDSKGGDIEEWPIDLRVRQFPEVSHV